MLTNTFNIMRNLFFAIILLFSSISVFSQGAEVPKEKAKKIEVNLLDTDSRFNLDTCLLKKAFCINPRKVQPVIMTLNTQRKKVKIAPYVYRFKKNGTKRVIWRGKTFVADGTRNQSGKVRNQFDIDLRRASHRGRAYLAFDVDAVESTAGRKASGRSKQIKAQGKNGRPTNFAVNKNKDKPGGRILPLLVCVQNKCTSCPCRANIKTPTKFKNKN